MPVNWYAALVIIVILGLASVGLAKYHYNHNGSTEPSIGTTWHAGLAFDICGTQEAALPATTATSTVGLTSSGNGVLIISPKTSAEAGSNATLGQFASTYTGLTLTNTTLKYPSTKVPKYFNGDKCAAGTPDAGKKGVVMARSWVFSTSANKNGETTEVGGQTTYSAAGLRFVNRQLITVGFAPSGTELPKPPASVITALVQILAGTSPTVPTSTTLPTSTSVTSATVTTTTLSSATTTTTKPAASSTTTTTKPAASTTTTTKPKQ
jgi:hypothetical protein